ncbi:hypothetical protein [Alicyclobacillus mengziensis]|uniref:Uncharacterized protein n=1 Tax=Alicyclobacillus mengziensis TaxID=2931921 RepID=A0A9X7Z7P8_9BACL|nr:hypothetical protein [Alicyclobacillus mengziensis]QSO48647.1 hypothetical protein JZ786_06670 [Alicyclobacillus mengziensis]
MTVHLAFYIQTTVDGAFCPFQRVSQHDLDIDARLAMAGYGMSLSHVYLGR